MKNLVIYHDNCADGFTSAWICKKFLEDETEFYPAQHGDDPPDVTGRDVIIVDFSYKREIIEEMHDKASMLVVIDHHKTSEEELDGLPYCIFDMDRAGCLLTWDYFTCEEPPDLVHYVNEGDLWRFDSWESIAINTAIRSYPYTFDNWDYLEQESATRLAQEGQAIMRFTQSCADSSNKTAKDIFIAGHKVPVINLAVKRLVSKTINDLAEGHPFAAAWFPIGNGEIVFSLRSKKDGLDVGEIARSLGGGGHKNAAGFRAKLLDYMSIFE